ncbi:hypothetical protein [Methylobacterium sp. J-070]|uniref:hypothetical protein n=1 Tax=Methylobacterium sp. J-070 TaxID=2836650 RepID=UPI001FBB537A|nr:hypothetical protein [Methylobacterium sp. J-070]MCJ2054519.1 hypothetical protein [Methylobacterium sp. J-070]
MTARVTIYLPADVLKAVRVAALDQDVFVSDFITKAAQAYLASGDLEAPEQRMETEMPAARKVGAATRTVLELLGKAGPGGIKVSDLRGGSIRAGNTLGATDAAVAALSEAGLLHRAGNRWTLDRTDGSLDA